MMSSRATGNMHFLEYLRDDEGLTLIPGGSMTDRVHILMEPATASPVSPASRTRTVVFASSERRDARTSPAVPPPTMTKSYELSSSDCDTVFRLRILGG